MKYLGLFIGVGSGYYLYQKSSKPVDSAIIGLSPDFLAGIKTKSLIYF